MSRTASGVARNLKKIADHMRAEQLREIHDAKRRQLAGDSRGVRRCINRARKFATWAALLDGAHVRVVVPALVIALLAAGAAMARPALAPIAGRAEVIKMAAGASATSLVEASKRSGTHDE
jgi:hypothetical protein